MKKKYLIIILIILGFQLNIVAQANNETFTIYLVRHSEKDLTSDNYSDPPLIQNVTKMYGTFAALKDVNLDIRDNEFFTLLGPSAMSKDLEVKEYNAQELKDFSKLS